MARAYKKTYLNGAMCNLAVMLDCGVNKYGFPLSVFYDYFLSCDVSKQFAQGNPRYLVGLSGAELADLVVQAAGGSVSERNDGSYNVSPEYWAGWVLAFYQWYSDRSFNFIQNKGLDICVIKSLYHPLHEADLMKFVDVADRIVGRK